MTKTIKTTTISKQISGAGQQAARYHETLTLGAFRLRIAIRSDNYEEQSHARIEAFSAADLAWHEIHTIIGAAMATKAAYARSLSDATFAADRAELLRVAAAILGAE